MRYSFLHRDLYEIEPERMAEIRWAHLSYIMQGSMNVLNPVRRVRQSFLDFAFRHIARPKKEFFASSPRIWSGCTSRRRS